MFQANTNASLKNLETRVRQLALNMKNQSKDSSPSDTKKNPKYCTAITLRSGRELKKIEEYERKLIENEKQSESGKENKLYRTKLTDESENQRCRRSSKLKRKN